MKIMMNAHEEGNDGCTTSKSQAGAEPGFNYRGVMNNKIT
jgi:hypothetical protein